MTSAERSELTGLAKRTYEIANRLNEWQASQPATGRYVVGFCADEAYRIAERMCVVALGKSPLPSTGTKVVRRHHPSKENR